MSKAILTTTRLTIRQLRLRDVDGLIDLHSDAEVMRYIGSGVRTPAEADSEAYRLVAAKSGKVFGPRAVRRRLDAAFLGWVGFLPLEGGETPEIAYRLARAHWGQGYGREATARLLAHGFEDLGLPRVVAVTAPENARSQAVLSAIGMNFVDRRRVYGVDDCLFYEARA